MRITAKHYLNVRSGKASVNAPKFTFLSPGDEIEVDGKLYEGDKYEGSNLWVKDFAGNYYWAGGFENIQEPIDVNIDVYNYWHLRNFDIKKIHEKGLNGDGINICVIDTGIPKNHIEFNYNKIIASSILHDADVYDTKGHGSSCIGIIHAQGKKVMGMAPKAIIHSIKTESGLSNLKRALREANKIEKLHIISISRSIPTIDQEMADTISDLIKKGTTVIVGHANIGMEHNAIGDIDGVISVGAFDEHKKVFNYTTSEGQFTIAAPGHEIFATNVNGYEKATGTSFATPFVSGICALMLQKQKDLKPAEIKNKLVQSSSEITENGRPIKLINPSLIFNI